MDQRKVKLLIIVVLAAVVLVIVLVIVGVLFSRKSESPYAVGATLNFWGVEDENLYKDAFSRFGGVYPNVSIEYRQFRTVEVYERTLIDALAAGSGPDIFMVRNNDLYRKLNKITPAPADRISVFGVQQQFPEIVQDNFVVNNRVYALPLSVDTLALIYNKDIFNESGVVFAPETWEDFQELVLKLVVRDERGQIERPAAALGWSSDNVHYAGNLLSFLMLQSGTGMVSEDYRSAIFASQQGANALAFYSEFSDTNADVYTWNASFPSSVEMFSSGDVAVIFDYGSTLQDVRDRAPFLNIGVAPVPQPAQAAQSISYANYWGYTISRQSKHPVVAWDFVLLLTTDPQTARVYTENSGHPPALLVLIERYQDDQNLHVFVNQALTARSWPEPNADLVSEIFDGIIEAVGRGAKPSGALQTAQQQVTDLMR